MRNLIPLLLICLLAAAVTADEPRKIALLVGVSDYQSRQVDDLQFAENDIRVVGSQLKLMGFKVTSLSGKAATRKKTIATIDSFMAQAAELESDDIVFVMFSGHGQQIRVRENLAGGNRVTEVPYFCPVDSLVFDESKFATRGKTETQVGEELNFVSLNRVLRGLDENSNSLNNLLVVDACRNNPSKGKSAGVSGTSATVPRGVNILFAAGSGQKSWESADKDIPHGVFTHFLIKGLQGDAKNQRDQVTWSRLASYLQDEVSFSGPKLAGDEKRIQNPHSIINSTNLIVLGEANSDGLVEERLYQSLRNPDEVFDMAELCREKEFVVQPVYAAMLMANEDGCRRGWEILKPHFESPELITLMLKPTATLVEQMKKYKQLRLVWPVVMASLVNDNHKTDAARFVNPKGTLAPSLICLATQIADVNYKYSYTDIQDPGLAERLSAANNDHEKVKREWERISAEFEASLDESTIEKFEDALSAVESSRKSTEKERSLKDFPGKPFPTLSGKDLQGNPISTDDFKGKILIVDLWAFW